jgi:hypothetical protein
LADISSPSAEKPVRVPPGWARLEGHRRARRKEYVDRQRCQFGDQASGAFDVALGVALFDHNRTALDVPEFTEGLAKGKNSLAVDGSRRQPDEAHDWNASGAGLLLAAG